MKNYFITGTDTGVGKTFITAALLHALQLRAVRVAPMKPVAAGTIVVRGAAINEDVAALQEMTQHRFLLADVNPYTLTEPIAPHIAAAREQVHIDIAVIRDAFARLRAQADCVLVEGAGGFLVPLSATQSMAEVPQALNLDVILVVGMRLGCLNHALLTVEAIHARGLHLAGWIANAVSAAPMGAEADNVAALGAMIDAPCLGKVPYLQAAARNTVQDAASRAAPYLHLDRITA